jgi:hypothetical protein
VCSMFALYGLQLCLYDSCLGLWCFLFDPCTLQNNFFLQHLL